MNVPTGKQFVLQHGNSHAVITELAAGLRELRLDGVDVVQSYPESSMPPYGQGIVLVPWPNRIAGSEWNLDGVPQLLDITERRTGSALHGLLRNAGYTVSGQGENFVTLEASVFPQHGYPFHLDTSVGYELTSAGMSVTHTVTNLSDAPAPVGIGTHPFFRIGDVPNEDLTITVAANTVFEVDERLIPTAEVSVDDTRFDLRRGARVGDLNLDHAFGGVYSNGGENVHSLTAPDGSRVEVWGDESFDYVQVFTTRDFPLESGPGLAVAIEPMTIPPDAFNSGQSLKWVEPGETWVLGWGVRYSAAE